MADLGARNRHRPRTLFRVGAPSVEPSADRRPPEGLLFKIPARKVSRPQEALRERTTLDSSLLRRNSRECVARGHSQVHRGVPGEMNESRHLGTGRKSSRLFCRASPGSPPTRWRLTAQRSFQLALIPNPLKRMGILARHLKKKKRLLTISIVFTPARHVEHRKGCSDLEDSV
jgi:hypothetical protein